MMQKYRQYRALKKVKKLLSQPAKKEIYTPPDNLYMSDKSLDTKITVLDPNRQLRLAQLENIARLLLQQLDRLEKLHTMRDWPINDAARQEIEATSTDIHIIFEEFNGGVLWTEAEKAARKRERTKFKPIANSPADQAIIDLAILTAQIQDWQQEKFRRKKKLTQLESSIHELALNVHDVRCAQIMRDRKTALAALDSTIRFGVTLLRDIFAQFQTVCATLESK